MFLVTNEKYGTLSIYHQIPIWNPFRPESCLFTIQLPNPFFCFPLSSNPWVISCPITDPIDPKFMYLGLSALKNTPCRIPAMQIKSLFDYFINFRKEHSNLRQCNIFCYIFYNQIFSVTHPSWKVPVSSSAYIDRVRLKTYTISS